MQDEKCVGDSVATHEGNVRVCRQCAVALEHEGFVIEWDNARSAK